MNLIKLFILIIVLFSVIELVLSVTLESDSIGDRIRLSPKIAVPDEPLQLIRPDGSHKKLVIVEENVNFLHQIKPPLAIVAVVGKFHSGKSFLMNQLMGKKIGFGIGPSVQPKTMGIWMWGKPAKMKLDSGEELSVIFLDTEGFAANNVSENYDAKVFAVATILSTHLLYNSVKIIDQVDIDYLELLARRTQLFALRSQMSRSKWIENFNEDLLSFPPLTWVVQDFFQSVLDGETPKQWLHRLMSSHTRDNEAYEISILDIFKTVDCHTMFLPATKKVLLNDLSKASEDELTEEYKEERDELVAKLKKQLSPKSKGNKHISGVEIAHLLRVLVNAANEGSLADVPSRWDTFVERLQMTATEDCLKFYDDEVNTLIIELHGNNPIKAKILDDWHNVTATKALELMKHLLQGLDETLNNGLTQLQHRIDLSYERSKDINEKKIKLRLNHIKESSSIKAEEDLNKLVFPVSTASLVRVAKDLSARLQSEASAELKRVLEDEELPTELETIDKTIKFLSNSYQLKNNLAVQKHFENSIAESVERFYDVVNMDWDKSLPQRPHMLDKIIKQGQKQAHVLFSSKVSSFEHEVQYGPSESHLKEKLREAVAKVEAENNQIAGRYLRQVAHKLSDEFADHTGSEKIPLPAFDDTLDKALRAEVDRTLRTFEAKLGEYLEYESYTTALNDLKGKIADTCDLRHRQNIDAFTAEVLKPLESAKRLIMLSADKYSTVFSFKQFLRSVCLINLDDGKPKSWPFELKAQIIDNFVQNDAELSEAIKAKEGFWSTIVGFFEWLLWFIGFIK